MSQEKTIIFIDTDNGGVIFFSVPIKFISSQMEENFVTELKGIHSPVVIHLPSEQTKSDQISETVDFNEVRY
ncbi:hypothetical protein TNCV_4082051 [Trichonephila clavipes]|nr:hypothetical protein TNCV_4082051 [Trichonephila clavipes]